MRIPTFRERIGVVTFDCTKCGKKLQAHPRHAGRSAVCPRCGTSVPIPSEPAAAAADEPLSEPSPIEMSPASPRLGIAQAAMYLGAMALLVMMIPGTLGTTGALLPLYAFAVSLTANLGSIVFGWIGWRYASGVLRFAPTADPARAPARAAQVVCIFALFSNAVAMALLALGYFSGGAKGGGLPGGGDLGGLLKMLGEVKKQVEQLQP
jgi:hypothetical protein